MNKDKKVDDFRTEYFSIRLTKDEKELLKRVAKEQYYPVGAYIRKCIFENIEKDLKGEI